MLELVVQAWHDNLMWKILEQPAPILAWVLWLMIVNTASLMFWHTRYGRLVLMFWLANVLTMSALYWLVGYVRLLGLSHVIWWTPMLYMIWLQRQSLTRQQLGSTAFVWLMLLVISDAVSLVIDYVDVIRYLAGDRLPV